MGKIIRPKVKASSKVMKIEKAQNDRRKTINKQSDLDIYMNFTSGNRWSNRVRRA